VTVIALLVAAAIGVAGLLYKWTARLDVEVAQERFSLSAPSSSASWTRARRSGASPPAEIPVARPVIVEPERIVIRTPVRANDDEDDDTATMRFVRPSDLVVQLLPGRLEVLEGRTPHREIRFLCAPGESQHIILGRKLGVTPHYIGLGSPTVSRRHARFDFADNQWVVKNLSHTNPLIINDDELSDAHAARPLADGDRLRHVRH
jgi:hypothetical protein